MSTAMFYFDSPLPIVSFLFDSVKMYTVSSYKRSSMCAYVLIDSRLFVAKIYFNKNNPFVFFRRQEKTKHEFYSEKLQTQ